jgi:hypothetical protein
MIFFGPRGARTMAWLYKRALDDAIGLTSMLIMVLLDDEVYKTQKKALIEHSPTLSTGSRAAGCQIKGPSQTEGRG